MNNPYEAYPRHAKRVQWLMVWLEAALKCHFTKASQSADLWPRVEDLRQVERELIPLLCLISGTSEEKITKVLNSMNIGGQSHE